MTLLPEPREARRLYMRPADPQAARQQRQADEQRWAAYEEVTPDAWTAIGEVSAIELTHALEPVADAWAGVARRFTEALAVVTINVNWDLLLVVLAAGTKDRSLRRGRKHARMRVRDAKRLERTKAQPSYGGKAR